MSVIKIVAGINWVLISIYGGFVVWALLQVSKPSHEMPGVESIIKGFAVFLLLALIGMNVASYQWMKIMALVMVVIALLVIKNIAQN